LEVYVGFPVIGDFGLGGLGWEAPASVPPILMRLKMEASPALDYLSNDNLSSFGALGPVSMLRVFAKSVGRKFIKGHAFGNKLCPERA